MSLLKSLHPTTGAATVRILVRSGTGIGYTDIMIPEQEQHGMILRHGLTNMEISSTQYPPRQIGW